MAYVMEGVSLFGATPRLGIISADSFIILASRIIGEAPSVDEFPIASEISVLEEVHTQGFVRNEFVVDLGVASEVCSNIDSAIGHGIQAEGTSNIDSVKCTGLKVGTKYFSHSDWNGMKSTIMILNLGNIKTTLLLWFITLNRFFLQISFF